MPPPGPDAITTVGSHGALPVLLLHPWWGLTDAVREWADALAAAGRRVVMPDIYGGRIATSIAEAEELESECNNDDAMDFLEQCADGLAAGDLPWAAMGFSMGAAQACHLASRGQAGPDEVVLFYGAWMPAGDYSRTRRAVLHAAPDDEYCTDEEIAAFKRTFTDAGADVTVHLYEHSRHWFAERGSPAFDDAAFVLSRTRVLDQLGTAASR